MKVPIGYQCHCCGVVNDSCVILKDERHYPNGGWETEKISIRMSKCLCILGDNVWIPDCTAEEYLESVVVYEV